MFTVKDIVESLGATPLGTELIAADELLVGLDHFNHQQAVDMLWVQRDDLTNAEIMLLLNNIIVSELQEMLTENKITLGDDSDKVVLLREVVDFIFNVEKTPYLDNMVALKDVCEDPRDAFCEILSLHTNRSEIEYMGLVGAVRNDVLDDLIALADLEEDDVDDALELEEVTEQDMMFFKYMGVYNPPRFKELVKANVGMDFDVQHYLNLMFDGFVVDNTTDVKSVAIDVAAAILASDSDYQDAIDDLESIIDGILDFGTMGVIMLSTEITKLINGIR